jgi:hypothetical protein
MSHRTTVISRAQGALLGQIVGDALGSGVDGWSPERVRADFPDGVREMVANPELGTIKGQTTDKSELAMVLARALAERHEFEASNVQAAYFKWANSGALARDPAVSAALLDTMAGESNSNGALLRVAPLGIFGAGIWPGVVELWAREDGCSRTRILSALRPTSFSPSRLRPPSASPWRRALSSNPSRTTPKRVSS